jgi:hypothetical protein
MLETGFYKVGDQALLLRTNIGIARRMTAARII